MGLVNDNHVNTHLRYVYLPMSIIQTLRGNEQYFKVASYCLFQRSLIFIFAKIRADNSRRYIVDIIAALTLIAHEGFERGKDDSEIRIVQACHLVTEGLAPTRALNCQDPFALYQFFDDIALSWVKTRRNVEAFFQ